VLVAFCIFSITEQIYLISSSLKSRPEGRQKPVSDKLFVTGNFPSDSKKD